jgi:hypothetical protein
MKVLALAMVLSSCGAANEALINAENNKDKDIDTKPCTVTEHEDGSSVINCPDGSRAKVAAGKNGKDGVDGKTGKDGVDGKAGKDGKDGSNGSQGVAGTDGAAGATGAAGSTGATGAAGTNADSVILYMYTKDAALMGKVVSVDDNGKASVQLSNKAILSIPYGSSVVTTAGSINLWYASADCTGTPKFAANNNQTSNLFYDDIRGQWLKAVKGPSVTFSYASRLTATGTCTPSIGSISNALDVAVIDMSAYAAWFDYSTTGQPQFVGAPFQILPE